MKIRITLLLLVFSIYASAQIKIGNNPSTINSNSLLEMESTDKGFLPPRVALNSLSAVAPLTGTVPAGMLIFSSGGTVADGYYFWDGAQWVSVGAGKMNMVTKSATTTLTKTETFVLASGDITLTLPTVTSADNGLTITVKHIGTHTDEVTVATTGGATNDGVTQSKLYRWLSRTFVAYNGNWIRKDKEAKTNNVYDVCATGSWTTIQEVIDFLELHMPGPSVIRLSGETYDIDATVTIDLNYPVTIEGLSYGATTIAPATGIGSTPMFICNSEAYFKKIAFDGTALSGYGDGAGEDAIMLEGEDEYFEIKDCSFDHFDRAIVLTESVQLWLFETDITDAASAGVEVDAVANTGTQLTISECDFTGCEKGINLLSGVSAKTNIVNCTFYNTSGQVGINYVPASFTTFASMFITNNAWNNIGSFVNGFDFSLSRDANAFMENNAGMPDKSPSCYINVTNNATATSTALSTYWYKASWTNTSSSACKWTISNNRITFQPSNRRDAYITISGNILVSTSSATVNIGLVKSQASSPVLAGSVVRYGETTLRPGIAGQPFQFSTVIYLPDVGPGEYFELWCNMTSTGSSVTFQDVQWITNAH
jgi:hypothetical protein